MRRKGEVIEPEGGPISMSLNGSDGAKAFLHELFFVRCQVIWPCSYRYLPMRKRAKHIPP